MSRMRLAVTLLLLAAVSPLAAQSSPEAGKNEVLAVMKRLFDGMRAGDSAMVRSTFHSKIQMTTALVREGAAVIEFGEADRFARAVGTPHAEAFDERVYNPIVQIDGSLATIWTEYSFFRGGKFSHCGVDAFLLAKEAADWKIIAISDTRRKTGCRES